jgi:hypothetical protein
MPVGNVSVGFMSVDDTVPCRFTGEKRRMCASDGSGLFDSLPIQRLQHACHELSFSYSVDYACAKQRMRAVCRFGNCRRAPDGFAVALVRFPAAVITDELQPGSRPIRLMGSNYSREAHEGSVSEIVPYRMLGRAVAPRESS